VKHKLILEEGQDDVGYAVSFIPEGGNEPVMATGTDLQRYYCRASSIFIPMSHGMVADRFNRVAKPDLRICISFNPAFGNLTDRILIGLANVGLGIAHYPAISFGPRYNIPVGECYPQPFSLEMRPIVSLDMQKGQVFQGKEGLVIHPNTMLSVMRWEKGLPTEPNENVYADFELFASGFYRKGFFHTTWREILNASPGFTMGTVAGQNDIQLGPRSE
jgi:hypothetical protein